jgi:hypothetical protein
MNWDCCDTDFCNGDAFSPKKLLASRFDSEMITLIHVDPMPEPNTTVIINLIPIPTTTVVIELLPATSTTRTTVELLTNPTLSFKSDTSTVYQSSHFISSVFVAIVVLFSTLTHL